MSPAQRFVVVLRVVLLLAWCGFLVAAVTTGQRSSTLDRLDAAVSQGRVAAVRVAGGLPGRGSGFATVEVTWREGLLAYRTEVVEVRRPGAAPEQGTRGTTPTLVNESVAEHLGAISPGVVVEQGPRSGGWRADTLGFALGERLAVALLALWLVTVGFVAGGPEPWRATRWAWFWLLSTPVMPLVALGYLLLAAPAPGLPAPRDPGRRLRGGWALVIALALGSGSLLV